MDRRAVGLAALLGVPPGLGMGLALFSITRGEALVQSTILGVGAAIVLSGLIYVIATRGSVDEPPFEDYES